VRRLVVVAAAAESTPDASCRTSLPIVATEEPLDDAMPARPITRGDCVRGIRPCPWVSCRFHLLDVIEFPSGMTDVRSIRVRANANQRAVDRFTERASDLLVGLVDSCALDVADRPRIPAVNRVNDNHEDGTTLDAVGQAMGVVRERVRQIETRALAKLPQRARSRGLK
jgi:hypothetical protein